TAPVTLNLAPSAFVKVGARRVGKAHLILAESQETPGAALLTYVNRRGEMREVTQAQFVAIYNTGISTPVEVPVPVESLTQQGITEVSPDQGEIVYPTDDEIATEVALHEPELAEAV